MVGSSFNPDQQGQIRGWHRTDDTPNTKLTLCCKPYATKSVALKDKKIYSVTVHSNRSAATVPVHITSYRLYRSVHLLYLQQFHRICCCCVFSCTNYSTTNELPSWRFLQQNVPRPQIYTPATLRPVGTSRVQLDHSKECYWLEASWGRDLQVITSDGKPV
jgi:hypothetical protein